MDREIKFRVRDIKTKEIIGYECLFDNKWAESRNGIDWQPLTTNIKGIREQFTSFKDLKGIKIYEGDIITDSEGYQTPIEFSDGGFWCLRPNKTKFLPDEEYREVIGDIYSTPELLKS
jgi:hypothetical protein